MFSPQHSIHMTLERKHVLSFRFSRFKCNVVNIRMTVYTHFSNPKRKHYMSQAIDILMQRFYHSNLRND